MAFAAILVWALRYPAYLAKQGRGREGDGRASGVKHLKIKVVFLNPEACTTAIYVLIRIRGVATPTQIKPPQGWVHSSVSGFPFSPPSFCGQNGSCSLCLGLPALKTGSADLFRIRIAGRVTPAASVRMISQLEKACQNDPR